MHNRVQLGWLSVALQPRWRMGIKKSVTVFSVRNPITGTKEGLSPPARGKGAAWGSRGRCRFVGMEVVVMVDRFDVLPHGKVGKGVGSHVSNSFSVEGGNSGWLCLLTFQAP